MRFEPRLAEPVRRRRRLTTAPARRWLRFLPRVALLLDVMVMLVVGVTAAALRAWVGWFTEPLDESLWVAGAVILIGWVGVIAALGGYRTRYFGAGVDEYKIVVAATLVTMSLTSLVSYLTKYALSRGFFVLAFTLGIVLLILARGALRRAIHSARRAGALGQDVVIAGTPEHIDEIGAVLSRESWLGYRVLGAVVPAIDLAEETGRGIPILGATPDIEAVLDETNADVVFLAGGALTGAHQMRKLFWNLEHKDIQVIVAPLVTDVSRERIRVRPVAGLPLVHIEPPRHARARRHAKRAFDLAVSLSILVAIAPLVVAISCWVKIHDGGPVFFRQVRTGRDGEEFECLKFRSMVVDAEVSLGELQRTHGYDGAGLFKVKDDPRITRPGRFLRRFSLDELPQLVNVWRGDMSLVGPRPPLPAEVATYDEDVRRRLQVRPGITGLWQVSGRSDLSWSETVRLDLYYVDNWSMLQDLSILVKTVGAVLGSRGAY